MDDNDPIMRKVRALLLKAESTRLEFPEEAENCTELAEKMMVKYSIDQSRLDAAALKDGKLKPDSFGATIFGPHAQPKWLMFDSMFNVFSCRTVGHGKLVRGDRNVTVYGFESDLDIAWTLWEYIYDQMVMDMETNCPRDSSSRRSYILAYAGRISKRLESFYREEMEQAEQAVPGTALVVASKSDAVDAVVSTRYPVTRTDKIAGPTSHAGYLAGKEGADRADISLSSRRVDEKESIAIG